MAKEEDMWKVLVDGLTYDCFDDESEARRMATLIEKAEKTIEEIGDTSPRHNEQANL